MSYPDEYEREYEDYENKIQTEMEIENEYVLQYGYPDHLYDIQIFLHYILRLLWYEYLVYYSK